ncbi:MAG: tetratricopeptide repeat protein [Saprospiraceae bacterium]|nr:tetratricopeptide repeat protein [Saprospiraceae bacterium]
MRIYIIFFLTILLVSNSDWSLAQDPDAIREYQAGVEYYKLKNYDKAIPFFKAAIKEDPKFVHAYRTLISCYEQQGLWEDVIPYYEKTIELTPSDRALIYNFAMLYLGLKQYEKCKLYLQKAVDVDPTYSKAVKKLEEIETYLKKQNLANSDDNSTGQVKEKVIVPEDIAYNKALEEYRKKEYKNAIKFLNGQKHNASKANYFYLMAISYQQLKEQDNAIRAYERTLEIDDRHFDANKNLGIIFYNDHNFSEAAILFETAYERRKNDRGLLYNLATAHYFAEDYTPAISLLEKYVALDTKNGSVYYYLAKACKAEGQSKKANKYFDLARKNGGDQDNIEIDLGNDIAACGNEAAGYTSKGQYEKAIILLETCTKEHPKEARLHFNLGLNYQKVGNSVKALLSFKRATELDPAHAKAWQGRAIIHYERQEYSEAAGYYQKTLQAGKDDELVHYKLGNCYVNLSRFQQAIKAYASAIERNPKEKHFHFSLGLVYIKTKENQKSVKSFEEALKIDPDYLDARYHIGVNYAEMNEYELAIKEGEKIIKADEGYAKAYLLMAHCYKRIYKYVEAEKYERIAIKLDPSLR